MPTETDTIARLNISLPEALAAAMRDLARANDRPLSREVRRAFEAHIERERDAA